MVLGLGCECPSRGSEPRFGDDWSEQLIWSYFPKTEYPFCGLFHTQHFARQYDSTRAALNYAANPGENGGVYRVKMAAHMRAVQ